MPAGVTLPLVVTAWDGRARAAFERNAALIRRLARVEAPAEGPAPKGAISVAAEGAAFALPLDGAIDIAEERARLAKALDKLDRDLAGLRGRLANPKFVESAPPEVVEDTREALAQGEDEAGKVRAALDRLAELG